MSLPDHGIMVLDPGVTTGFAWLEPEGFFRSAQLPFYEACQAVSQWCEEAGENGAVLWERFDITPMTYRMRGSATALEVIGVVRYMGMRYGCLTQSEAPREARRAIPADSLHIMKWRTPGKVHANDAAAHLLAWLMRNPAMTPDVIRDMLVGIMTDRD